MVFKPTGGKWQYKYGWIKSKFASVPNPDYRILIGATHPVGSLDEENSNGRLMASAPEMFELLNQAFFALQRANIEEALRFDIDACLTYIESGISEEETE